MSTSTDTGTDPGPETTTARYDDLRRIETEVGTLIRRVKRVMGERAREVHPDLHPITYFILTHLAVHGPLRGADLSDAFGMDKGGVSRQVQTLVDLGLVERRPDAEDRRAILLPRRGRRIGDNRQSNRRFVVCEINGICSVRLLRRGRVRGIESVLHEAREIRFATILHAGGSCTEYARQRGEAIEHQFFVLEVFVKRIDRLRNFLANNAWARFRLSDRRDSHWP